MSSASLKRGRTEVKVQEPPQKRVLRLRHQSVETKLSKLVDLDVKDVSCVQELNRLSSCLDGESDYNKLLVTLLDKLKSASISMIQNALIKLLRLIISKQHDIDYGYLVSEVINIAQDSKTTSHLFKSELLSLCAGLVSAVKGENQYNQLMNLAKENLTDRASSVRSLALFLTGSIIKNGKKSGISFEDTLGMQLLVIDFIKDPEARVRSAALEVLSDLHTSHVSLESTVYDHASTALNDDYERVRTSALKLVCYLSQATPDRMITPRSASTSSIRMLDDGFMKVCDAINDLSYIVRTQAAKLMSEFADVSMDFLEQTLDKKLMSNMRKKQSAHERQREFYQSAEWSSGKRFADDAPKEFVTEESVSLINMGACGAFVHALEDEFMEVRGAAIDSMCVLAQHNASFAQQTQDFLVDMFNDEIEEVRLRAIQNLCQISQHLCLRDDQVDIIIGVLKDFSHDIRFGIHRLIESCRILTQHGLREIILALLENLRKYPEDKRSICRVMKELGHHHPGIMSPLLPELLSLDPHFDMPEPNMNDNCYAAVMISVYNAAAKDDTFISLFPEYVPRHYHYHRSCFPRLVPLIPQLEPNSMNSGEQEPLANIVDLPDLGLPLSKVSTQSMDKTARAQLLQLYLRDLDRYTKTSSATCARSKFLSEFIQSLLSFHRIGEYLRSGSDKHVITLSKQVVDLCERLLNLYNNITSDTIDTIRQFQLIARTLILSQKMSTNSAQPDEFKDYLKQLSTLKELLQVKNTIQLPFISRVFDIQDTLQAGNWSLLQSALTELNLDTLPLVLDIDKSVTMVTCELDEPKNRSDNPKKLTAGLAMCLPVRATVKNILLRNRLFIKISLPDQSEFIVPVKDNHLRPVKDKVDETELTADVVYSHGHWSESSYLEVSVLMKSDGLLDTIEICPPNKVFVTTKLEKKAHVGSIL